ncbi:hypothetical protein ACLOJK_041794 [Asimina triloba]
MPSANLSPFYEIPSSKFPQANQIPKTVRNSGKGLVGFRKAGSFRSATQVVPKDDSVPLRFDVGFPSDYSELLGQAKAATELGLRDEKQLLILKLFHGSGTYTSGDGEGGIEMTESMQMIREFCDIFISPEKATKTRIFFPEANEVEFARKSIFGGSSFKLDYLTKPSLFEDFGFVSKVKMSDRVKPDDEMFLVAYPYFNVNGCFRFPSCYTNDCHEEMLVVEELYKEAVVSTNRRLIIFNGELDRIRKWQKFACILKKPMGKYSLQAENFFVCRCYPGPWKEEMPSLKEVALDILPSA